jgi:hypothetical protein
MWIQLFFPIDLGTGNGTTGSQIEDMTASFKNQIEKPNLINTQTPDSLIRDLCAIITSSYAGNIPFINGTQ